MPVSPEEHAKTAVCPSPVLGMYEINRMPFGLTGAPSSFQHLVDKVLRGFLSTSVVHFAFGILPPVAITLTFFCT